VRAETFVSASVAATSVASLTWMGKGRRGDRLLPRLLEQIGVEPMTDNPMSSAHLKDRQIKNELGRALPLSYSGIWCRRLDSNQRRALQTITQSCDPSKKLASRQIAL
jgi:hypothetical protein